MRYWLHCSELPMTSSTGFSKRELETLGLVCLGFTSKEIGKKLGISSRTVEFYKKRLMDKMKARNSLAVSREAHRRGLVQ